MEQNGFDYDAVSLDQNLVRLAHFKFVGEGAANIVFEVILPPIVEDQENPFKGNLLRVPKAGTSAHSYQALQRYWDEMIKPAFEPDQLVRQTLVQLYSSDIVERLNAYLATVEGRRADFVGSRVKDVEFGMLVEDMREKNPNDLIIEFKPKWLTQSANAPLTAKRCRNCARAALRNSKNGIRTGMFSDAPPCPLAALLCSQDSALPEEALRAIANLFNPRRETATRFQQLRFGGWLRTNVLLKRLNVVQGKSDPMGPLFANPDHPEFPLAMTLRDCTLFIRISNNLNDPIDAKLGDLDKKNVEAKWKYWSDMEKTLAKEGFYERREQPAQRTRCMYEWGEWIPAPPSVALERAAFNARHGYDEDH